MSLTKKEEQELEILMTRLENADFEDAEAEDNNEVESDFRKWVSQKKKEWQEQAVNKYIDYEHAMTNISLWACPKCKLRHLASNYICSCGFKR